MQGKYNGVVMLEDLEAYSSELIVLDGSSYPTLWDGSIEIAPDDETVTSSNTTFFDIGIKSSNELKSFKHGKNQFYMAKVTGLIFSILVRSELKKRAV